MMYLGTIGRMVGIKCPTVQRLALSGRHSFNTTLGGLVKAQVGPVSRRTWDISLGKLTPPSDVGTLMEFATGVWGPGPFWFVPTDAPVINLLSPAVASCDPGVLSFSGGAHLLGSPPLRLADDGIAARSIWKNNRGTVNLGGPVPVIAGRPVTGSAWVAGSGKLRLMFLDSSGEVLSVDDSTAAEWSTPQRLSVTVLTPPTAASVQLVLTGPITQAARPAITWTTTAYKWGDGQGCHKAIVHEASRDVIQALDNPRSGRWSDVSFTVQEVG